MNVQEELHLFRRYLMLFPGDSAAVLGIASVHLAQQLERYINPSLDLGWIIRCILDINSQNLFTNCREIDLETSGNKNVPSHPEYNYADFLIKLCNLFLYAELKKEMSEEEAKAYILTKESSFYFGAELTALNNGLLCMVCPTLSSILEGEIV